MTDQSQTVPRFRWARRGDGYEVSSKGDKRFSAFYAIMPDGLPLEYHYQVDVKGYATWRDGKGKPPLRPMTKDELFEAYYQLWCIWSRDNIGLIRELYVRAGETNLLTDMFATTPVNQAHALSIILNKLDAHLKEQRNV
jgi:hypothetical protein